MKYDNPKIPEGINVSEEHPLKGFFVLLAAVTFWVVVIAVILSFTIGAWVKLIPFETEEKLASKTVVKIIDITNQKNESEDKAHHQEMNHYLQNLADDLSLAQDLPQGMVIKAHYLDDDTVNAFATLGGHIFIYQGLIDQLDNENALSMVIAHEIAHIKYRHPIVAMGRGVSLGLVLQATTGFGESQVASNLVGDISMFSTLVFNRSQESQADTDAFKGLVKHYGHGKGATDIFAIFKKSENILTPPELLSTHPMSDKRIKKLKELSQTTPKNCEQAVAACELKPLPDYVKS